MSRCWKFIPGGPLCREQRAAYMRWSQIPVGESTLDVRLTAKLTKRRKLTWRIERRHMRQMLHSLSTVT